MSKAYEIMTKSLATCHPEDSAVKVAKIMKERDIGDVLVVSEGKLQGIITDRDLAVKALSDGHDMESAPVSKYMSTDIVTGASNWGLNKVAKTMAKHQIRRLPILEDGEVVGIISLGDVARHYGRKDVVTDSLKYISKPNGISSLFHTVNLGKWLGFSLLGLSAASAYWLTMSHTGQEFRKQVIKSKPYNSAIQAVNTAGANVADKVNEAASSKPVKNFRRQVRTGMKELSTQLPTIQYKPPKNRSVWFH